MQYGRSFLLSLDKPRECDLFWERPGRSWLLQLGTLRAVRLAEENQALIALGNGRNTPCPPSTRMTWPVM